MPHESTSETLERLEERVVRIESRLVQLMIHMGLNPYEKTYPGTPPPAGDA